MKLYHLIALLAAASTTFAQEASPLMLPDSNDGPAVVSPPTEQSEPPSNDQPTTSAAEPILVTPQASNAAHSTVDRMRDAYRSSPTDADGSLLTEPASPLDTITPVFRVASKSISDALRILGRPHGISFVVAPDARDALVTADMSDATVRECLLSMLEPEGLHYEERAGYITVRRNRTEYYVVNYPALKRTSTGSVSVNLSASQNQSSGQGGMNGMQTGAVSTSTNGAQASGTQQDASTLSIEKEMNVDAWEAIEDTLRDRLAEGERLSINRFTGIAAITASDRRHSELRPYIDLLNRRMNQQVHIQARIVEISLTDQEKLGVDWTQALTSASNASVLFDGNALTNLTVAGANTLKPDTFGLRIGAGKLTAVITALSQQGNVRTESQPSVTTLVNQTTYIKIGEDRTFFSLSSSTSINQPSNGSDTNVTNLDTYDRFSQTFGNVLEVTPSVGDDGIITLIAAPVISRLKSIAQSPDGRQSGPDTDSKATESIIRLRSGETGMMGGFVFSEEVDEKRGVPFLGKIPGLGHAFRTDAKTTARTELLIFITATLDPI